MHPAVAAWARHDASDLAAYRVVALKERPMSSVYRLIPTGRAPEARHLPPRSVIAKRSTRGRVRIEGLVYREFLPHLDLPAPGFLGAWEDPGDACGWIFLEDLGEVPYEPGDPDQRAQAARWLGRLHRRSAGRPELERLPDRGARHHALLLKTARSRIGTWLGDASARGAGEPFLRDIAERLERVEARWGEVEELCAGAPKCLVHGDFVSKNLRRAAVGRGEEGARRERPEGLELVPFDWHAAGVGPAAADLGATVLPEGGLSPAYEAYREEVCDAWPRLDCARIAELSRIGQLFWCLACIGKDARQLGAGGHTASLRRLAWYAGQLARIAPLVGAEPT